MCPCRGGLRFVFYGRVSTEDHQDQVTSLARQQHKAATLVAGHGKIVAEFFDVRQSRTLAWARRPQAAAPVAGLADPDRGWDAIMIGEYERAFYGGQYASMAPLFGYYGVQPWTPEVSGRIDFRAEDHEETMLALGLQSKREIAQTKIRVRAAMGPDPGAGPVSGRPSAVRVPAGRCRAAPELGDPRTDPHGDPIPTRDGRVAETPSQDLGSLGPGQRGRVARVSDRDPRVLRFLTDRGIALGDILKVREVRPGGAVTVQARSGVHLLDAPVAAAIRVEADQ